MVKTTFGHSISMTSLLNDKKPAGVTYRYAWMFGRRNDLLFLYIGPLILAMAVYSVVANNVFAAGLLFALLFNGIGLNQLHLGPSWFFYLDSENRQYWSEHKFKALAFYAGPPIILLASGLAQVYVPFANYAFTTLWGMQHFIQQNFGMLVLYHDRKSGEAIVSRELQLRSIWSASLFFILFYFHTLMPAVRGAAFNVIAFIFALVAIFYSALYVRDLRSQVKAGASLNVPALIFWSMSIVYFAPFAFLKYDAATAWVVPGILHWCQYLFLNYMLVKYKYKDADNRAHLPPLNPILLFGLTALALLVFSFALYAWRYADSTSAAFVIGLLFGVSNVHYFQDAFLWKFREQFQRDAILPYLKEARIEEAKGQASA